MVYARLVVTLPETMWVTTLSRSHPEATLTALSAVAVGDDVVTLLEIDGCDPDAVREAARSEPELTEFTVVVETGGRLIVSYRIRSRIYRAAERAGVPPVYPVVIRDGRAQLELEAGRTTLSTFVDELEAEAATVDVRELSASDGDHALLTDRQWEVLRTAADRGYYDSPRGCSTADLAEAVGIAPSTASDILRRAERRVVEGLLAGTLS